MKYFYYILHMDDRVIISKKYYIKRDGKVYRIKDDTEFVPHIHKTDGYRRLRINGKDCNLHRLIAEAFIPNPENKPLVDHINRNRTDNRVENLRWVTYSENCKNKTISP